MKTLIIALLITFACSAELSTEEEQQLMWNADGLVKFLKETAPYAREVIEIIDLIRRRDYGTALAKAMALINSGSQLIKRCIQYIVGSSVNLTIDWVGLGKCLLVFSQTGRLGVMLAFEIATFNIPGIIGAVNDIISYLGGNVPAQCKRFW